MRVQILNTGGTIGMVESPRGLVPGADLAGWLATLMAGTDLEGSVHVAELVRLIDSSNSVPDDWQAIVDHLRAHRDDADAFVVLHGTDTMAYTTAALAYALTGFDRPTVVTGSQLPAAVVGSDAAANVVGAIQAASGGRADGVSLFFGARLLAGARSTKVSSWSFAGFASPNVPPLAYVGVPWHWDRAPEIGCGWTAPRPYRRHDVMIIDMYPGITGARLAAMLDPPPRAIIMRAYGVGDAPSAEPGLVGVVADMVSGGVPVIVSSQCHQADVRLGRYETGQALADVGAVGSGDMTLEATYAKTVFLLSQGLSGADLAAWIGVNIAGELTGSSSQ